VHFVCLFLSSLLKNARSKKKWFVCFVSVFQCSKRICFINIMEHVHIGLIYSLAIVPRTEILWEDVHWNRLVQKTFLWRALISAKGSDFLDQLNYPQLFNIGKITLQNRVSDTPSSFRLKHLSHSSLHFILSNIKCK